MPKQDKKKTTPLTIRNENTFSFLKDWHCLALLGLLLVIFFREIIFQKAFFWEDFLYYFYPVRNFATVSLANGEIPLWNPYTFGGMPFLADIQTTVFYLPNFLLIPFVSNGRLDAWYHEMFLVAHFFLAGVTMFYCARAFGLSRIAATFCAFVYMLSGFAIVHTIHQVVLVQAAWFPLIVLLFRKTMEELSLLSMSVCSFVLSMSVLGGHPQFTLYIFFFLFVFFLYEQIHFVREQKISGDSISIFPILRRSLLAAGVILFAVGFSAIQLLPTFELANLSVREEITFAKSSEGQLWWQQLITFLVPKFYGSSSALQAENPIRYWGPGMYWSFWETCIYTGVAAFSLAIISLSLWKENRFVVFFGCFGVFALLYALGDNFVLHPFFYKVVPGFDKFRSMGRWGFFVTFAVALMSGFGLQQMLSNAKGEKKKLFSLILLVIFGITSILTVLVHTGALNDFIHWQASIGAFKVAPADLLHPHSLKIVKSQTLASFFIVGISCGILYLFLNNTIKPILAVLLLFAAQFIDMHVFGFVQNNAKVDPGAYFSERKNYIEQIKGEEKNGLFRVNARNRGSIFLDRNQGMLDKIFLMEGYTPLALQRVLPPAATPEKGYQLLNTKYRLKVDTLLVQRQMRTRMRFELDSLCLPRAMFVYNYRVFENEKAESTFLAGKEFNPWETVVLEEKPQITLADTTQTLDWNWSIEEYRNNAIRFKGETPKTGLFLVSEIFYPGWNAYVDGKQTKIYRADWSLRAIVVDKGEHTIEMKFEPEPYYSGMKISLATLFLCVAIGGFDFYRKRKSPSNPKSEI
ncbi:MAG: YfhO family protein [Ignavibacteriales bacterium]|nr:YfhO family protein [Ignavibacteriales bacterium]